MILQLSETYTISKGSIVSSSYPITENLSLPASSDNEIVHRIDCDEFHTTVYKDAIKITLAEHPAERIYILGNTRIGIFDENNISFIAACNLKANEISHTISELEQNN